MKVLGMILLVMSCSSTQAKYPILPTVDHVDLDRYLGKWYEIARLDQRFQKGCTATEAIYSKRKDGEIKVLNRCRLNTPDGKLKEAVGRAWVTDKNTNAKLKVQFFLKRFKIPFLSGKYWILDLDEDYQNVIIGDPSRKYLWILSRSKEMKEGIYQELVDKAEDLHFDTTKLLRTVH